MKYATNLPCQCQTAATLRSHTVARSLPGLSFTIRPTCTGTSTCGGMLCSAMSPDSAYSTWIVGSQCGEDGENALLIAAPIEWEWRGGPAVLTSTPLNTCLVRWAAVRVTNTTTLADLGQMLVEEWDAIPQQSVSRLVTA
ncbi:hypothetical protein KUCAC02_018067 [Chaenocephalus aceratus]|uniref:Uncharacterized protein n=1 Tax=Chaenocephalus aceratus TaxID=36190 RepID=A0ACB9W7M8_CHAAC|nr:hypothetical protein KUCAC02_018067 [Chaenocephalus aceratus]